MADTLIETMELFFSLGLIVTLVIFARLAVKARSTGSFRFQLSIFMLIWVLAEVPKVAGALGLISTAGFGLIGLTFHMISMFAFALFIGAKSYHFLRTPAVLGLVVQTGVPKAPHPPSKGEMQN